ncbi:CoA ester lyase [Jatrophihabitans sp.]|uniref:HpcH/HpaI aldolase/citrate lyase family protein n=1 Tax=Jatrophihabitans sp. TaxID=1932789 RepID=UPI0030C68829|nr:CoA ester lyase [Jatrophihabitans sp.]
MTAATSWLFVPGNRPERFAKAVGSGAGEVIIDLEDAVPPDAKRSARDSAVHWVTASDPTWVRINAVGTAWHRDDVAALGSCSGLRGVLLPKAERAQDLVALRAALPVGVEVIALVESARGIRDVNEVATCGAVLALAFGSLDFALDIGAEPVDDALHYARSAVVVASRAAGLASPIDGVTTAIHDRDALARDATLARRLGFGGKLCIHPAQVPIVNDRFAPDAAELDWAQRLLSVAAEAAGGAFVVDGQMIDEPVLEQARRIVQRAAQ